MLTQFYHQLMDQRARSKKPLVKTLYLNLEHLPLLYIFVTYLRIYLKSSTYIFCLCFAYLDFGLLCFGLESTIGAMGAIGVMLFLLLESMLSLLNFSQANTDIVELKLNFSPKSSVNNNNNNLIIYLILSVCPTVCLSQQVL